MNSKPESGENVGRQVEGGTVGQNTAHPLRSAFAAFFSAIEEGLQRAARYEALARKTNGELASLGVERPDLPRFVMFGDR
jgi:hypothetical protein